jgi:predicted transcriptional regulator
MAEAANKADEKATVDKNPVQAFFDEKGKETAENLAKQGSPVKISLTNKTMVEFTKDYGKHIKKGHKQEVSDVAFEIYNKAGVVKKV